MTALVSDQPISFSLDLTNLLAKVMTQKSFAAFLVIVECLHLLVPKSDGAQIRYWPQGYVEDRAFVQSSHLRWIQEKRLRSAPVDRDLLGLYHQTKRTTLEKLKEVPKELHQLDLWGVSDPRRQTLRYFNTAQEEQDAGDDIYVDQVVEVDNVIDSDLELPTLD